ncbi:MAG TPA: ATP synthase F1 subunit epsilon, partial [Alphaproteobacteria bacterium]|nr:ATP synthase F1 subunit epsilon [Alphaproteobacteria bacterium]
TPARLLVSEQASMVVMPGGEGDFGVLPGHAPLISTIRPGALSIHKEGGEVLAYFVSGGFAEAGPERCALLAEEAVLVADIDIAKANTRLEEARAALGSAEDDLQRAAAENKIAVNEAMIATAEPGR